MQECDGTVSAMLFTFSSGNSDRLVTFHNKKTKREQVSKAMDPMIIGIAVVALSLLLAVLVWLKNSSEKDVKQRPRPRQENCLVHK